MDSITVVIQRTPSDCGIATLAMLLGYSYEDVYLEVAKIDKRRSRRGLYMSQIKRVARALGKDLTLRRRFDPEEDTGILRVDFAEAPSHVVMLWKGIIIDTDGTLYEYDTYLALNAATPKALLTLKE